MTLLSGGGSVQAREMLPLFNKGENPLAQERAVAERERERTVEREQGRCRERMERSTGEIQSPGRRPTDVKCWVLGRVFPNSLDGR